MKTIIYILVILGLSSTLFGFIPKYPIVETYTLKVIPYSRMMDAQHYKMTLEEFKERTKYI